MTSIPIPSLYGLSISLAILACLLTAEKLLPKNDRATLWDISFWVIVSGILGARAYHVIDYHTYYLQNPIRILQLQNGGLGIWGAVLGGALAAIVVLKNKKENILKWLDVIAITLPLGQAIGRFGNFFNKELYGKPTSLPWGFYIDPADRPLGLQNYSTYHPLFFYEAGLNLILFGVLLRLYKKKKLHRGAYLGSYIASYGTIRFFLEYFRINPWTINGLNVSQVISILALLIGLFLITYERFFKKSVN